MKSVSPLVHHATRWFGLTILTASFLLAACAPAVPAQGSDPTAAATVTTQTAGLDLTASPQVASPSNPTAGSTTRPAAQAGQTTYNIVPGQSKVTYQVGETFLNQNNRFNLAVGVTTQVTGSITGDESNPSAVTLGTFEVDISKFASDSGQRDRYIRNNGLQSSQYPIAKFVPTKIETLPATYTDGQEVTLKVTGDLTVKTTTRPVTWDVTVKLSKGVVTGEATTELLMSDFHVGPISILGMLNTEDKVKLTFDFVAKP